MAEVAESHTGSGSESRTVKNGAEILPKQLVDEQRN